MLANRLRRWPNIKPALGERLVFSEQDESKLASPLNHWPRYICFYFMLSADQITVIWNEMCV